MARNNRFDYRHVAAALRPRLGRLAHHPPREIRRLPTTRISDRGTIASRISLVTPSFNQATYIERTLRSVLEQNYPYLDYWVQDGASTDQTAELLERWQPRIAGWRSEPDQGQSDALNRGFARTTGEIMGWLNADDLLLPGSLECIAHYFTCHPEIDVVYGDRLLIDEHDREIGSWILPKHNDAILSWADFVPQETLFWRRTLWQRSGARMDDSFHFAMDWELLVRFRDAGARFAHINRFLGAFRIHEHQKTSASINEVGHPEMDRIRERCLGRTPKQTEILCAVAPYLVKHLGKHLLYRLIGRV